MAKQPKKDQMLDALLVLKAKDGDAKALSVLFRRWQPRLLTHAGRLTRNAADAQDVVQEVAITLSRKLHTLKDPHRFAPWVYQITSRRAADLMRGNSRRRARETAEQTETLAHPHPDVGVSVRQALTRLSPNDQAVLALFYRQDLTVAEIAQATDTPLGTVKSRLYRARQHLKSIMEGDNP